MTVLHHRRPRRRTGAPAALRVRRHVACALIALRVVVVGREGREHPHHCVRVRVEGAEAAERLLEERGLRGEAADRARLAVGKAQHTRARRAVRPAALLVHRAKVEGDGNIVEVR
jgi:hypothetical protein